MMTQTFNSIYKVFAISVLIMTIFGLVMQTPAELINGLWIIFSSPNVLVTDYIELAGLGPTLVNAGILSFASVGMLIAFKHKAESGTISNLWLIVGFAFFGKHLFNVLPIFLGGFLYARFKGQPYKSSIMTILVASSLAPAVSQQLFVGIESYFLSILAALGMGILIGFVFEPLAVNVKKIHDGFNLYNGGLTAGIIAIFITSTFSSFGIEIGLKDIWSSGNNLIISIITIIVCVWMLFVGWYCNRELSIKDIFRRLKDISKTKSDYYPEFGTFCYINMGLIGIFCILVANILGMEISGLAFGAIVTIIGFGANGKNIPSGAALMLGVAIGTFLSPFSLFDPGIIAAFFFVLALCPIPNVFGWHWGVVAGIIHIHLVTSLAVPSGGMNLYNNGLSAGFVAILLVPMILVIKARREAKIKNPN